jgi:hypothetical protein
LAQFNFQKIAVSLVLSGAAAVVVMACSSDPSVSTDEGDASTGTDSSTKPDQNAGDAAPTAMCATAGCSADATCAVTGGVPVCTCKPGFSGDGKKCTVISHCAGGPCLNGGTCVDGASSYTCTCPAGYSGTNCETNVNDCAPNPCLNGGTCTDGVNSFTCACAAGYTGTTCQTNVNECAGNPCLNGGTCTDGVNSFTCACAAGYVSATCASRATSCSAIKTATPGAADGDYMIDPDGAGALPPITVTCDMTTDGGGYTYYAINAGIPTTRFDQANSCTAVGLNMAVPRTQAHLNAMFAKYGIAYFTTVPGVYGLAAGDYQGCVMSSTDATCAANWKAIGGGAWFAKNVKYSEPNGDYTPGCWLGLDGTGVDGSGFVRFNDGDCGYSTGAQYICSDNAK